MFRISASDKKKSRAERPRLPPSSGSATSPPSARILCRVLLPALPPVSCPSRPPLAPRPDFSPPRPPPRAGRFLRAWFADAEAQATALRARAGRLQRAPPTVTGCSTRCGGSYCGRRALCRAPAPATSRATRSLASVEAMRAGGAWDKGQPAAGRDGRGPVEDGARVKWVFPGCPGVGKGTYAGHLLRLLGMPPHRHRRSRLQRACLLRPPFQLGRSFPSHLVCLTSPRSIQSRLRRLCQNTFRRPHALHTLPGLQFVGRVFHLR